MQMLNSYCWWIFLEERMAAVCYSSSCHRGRPFVPCSIALHTAVLRGEGRGTEGSRWKHREGMYFSLSPSVVYNWERTRCCLNPPSFSFYYHSSRHCHCHVCSVCHDQQQTVFFLTISNAQKIHTHREGYHLIWWWWYCTLHCTFFPTEGGVWRVLHQQLRKYEYGTGPIKFNFYHPKLTKQLQYKSFSTFIIYNLKAISIDFFFLFTHGPKRNSSTRLTKKESTPRRPGRANTIKTV